METAAAFVRLNVVDHVHGVADQDDSVNAHDRPPRSSAFRSNDILTSAGRVIGGSSLSAARAPAARSPCRYGRHGHAGRPRSNHRRCLVSTAYPRNINRLPQLRTKKFSLL